LQVAEAFITASWFPGEIGTGLTPARSHHPDSGERHLADEMLEFIEIGLKPQGEGTSRYEGEALGKLGKDLLRPPCLFATGSPDGVTAEFPHPQHSYMLRLLASERHPRLGSGLLATLNLPEACRDAQPPIAEIIAGVERHRFQLAPSILEHPLIKKTSNTRQVLVQPVVLGISAHSRGYV
jgi:hypothetical protein